MACAERVGMIRVNSCILWVHIKIPFIIIGTINTVGSALLKGLWCFQDWHPELRWGNQSSWSTFTSFTQGLRHGLEPGCHRTLTLMPATRMSEMHNNRTTEQFCLERASETIESNLWLNPKNSGELLQVEQTSAFSPAKPFDGPCWGTNHSVCATF